MYQIWEGDLYLYTVDTEHEADEAREAGLQVSKQKSLAKLLASRVRH